MIKLMTDGNRWIETDLEPDDVLALKILGPCEYYIVGEGNAAIKYRRMKEYNKMLSNDAVVIEGKGSRKKFKADGKEFEPLPEYSYTNNKSYLEWYSEFARRNNPIMISLKPMRELLDEYSKDKVLISKLVSGVELYVYGSFNFRCVMDDYRDHLRELLCKFKRTVIYESFYVSAVTSINRDNFKELYTLFQERKDEPFFKTLTRLILNWNTHRIGTLKSKNMKSESYLRNKSIIERIKGHEDFQFVLADFALAAVYKDVIPKHITNIRFTDEGYTLFDYVDNTSNSTLYAYADIDLKEIFDLILKYLI